MPTMLVAATFRRVALLLALLTGLVPVASIKAQNKDSDVQALLANDDAVAVLRQQLAARQLTNLEYTRQAQELAAARRTIMARYDRTGQKELMALYRAAAKDKRDAAIAARRQADADARAQAIADAQARRDAEQAAARQAADDAAAAVARSVDDDAQEYTRIAIRHDDLMHRQSMKRISDAERHELPLLERQGADIKRKYAVGGPSQQQSAMFEKRLAELDVEKVKPARQAWITSSFPDADAIYAAYPEDRQRLAALSLIDSLLWEKAGQPQLPATAEKIARYRAMMENLNPKGGSRRVQLTNEIYDLVHSNQFKYEVMSRFAPAYAGAPLRELKEAQFTERKRSEAQKSNLTIVGMVLLMLAMPFLYLMKGERKLGVNRERNPDPNYPFQLPETLSVIKVFRKWIGLDFDCGLIYDKNVRTVTVTTHYYRSGQTYEINGTVYTTPGSWGSSTTTTTYYKYSYRTPDGRDSWTEFAGNVFPAEEGDMMSTVTFGGDVLFAYNHSQEKFVKLGSGIAPALAMRSRVVWYACLAVALIGTAFLYFVVLPGTLSEDNADKAAFAVPIVLGVMSGIYIVGFKLLVIMIRRSTFRLKWQPRFREFMVQRTPYLKKAYTAEDRATSRISLPQ
jgi:hypothetical protein